MYTTAESSLRVVLEARGLEQAVWGFSGSELNSVSRITTVGLTSANVVEARPCTLDFADDLGSHMSSGPENGCVPAAVFMSKDIDCRPRKRKRAIKKPYCLPCKKRRVICTMERPACVRCQRKTRTHECIYEGTVELSPPLKNEHTSDASTSVSNSPSESEIPPWKPLLSWEGEEFEEVRRLRHQSSPLALQSLPIGKIPISTLIDVDKIQVVDSVDPKGLVHTEYEDSRVLYRPSQSLVRLNISIPRAELFRNICFTKWLPTASLIASASVWPTSIQRLHQAKSMPSVDAALCAIGALKISERVEAASEYSNCLQQLIPIIQHEASSSSKFEICLTILLLICYELLNGAQIINYRRHTAAVAEICRQEAVLVRSGGKSVINESELGRLMIRTFRNIDTTDSCLRQERPRLTIAEWNTILPLPPNSPQNQIDFHHVFEFMNMSSHLTSRHSPVDTVLVTKLRQELQKTIDKSRYEALLRPCTSRSLHTSFLKIDLPSPFAESLYVLSATEEEENHRNTICGLMLTTRLNLDLHIPGTSNNDILNSAEQIIRVLQHIMWSADLSEIRGRRFGWSVYGLSTVKRALLKCGVTDNRYKWTSELLKASYNLMLS